MSKFVLLLFLLAIVSSKKSKEYALKATKYCEVNDPAIQSMAHSLKKSNVLDTAKKMFCSNKNKI